MLPSKAKHKSKDKTKAQAKDMDRNNGQRGGRIKTSNAYRIQVHNSAETKGRTKAQS